MTKACKAHTLRVYQSSQGRGTGFAGPQAQRPLRGWSLRLQSCLSSFGQAIEAKLLASGGLQGAERYSKRTNVGVHRFPA